MKVLLPKPGCFSQSKSPAQILCATAFLCMLTACSDNTSPPVDPVSPATNPTPDAEQMQSNLEEGTAVEGTGSGSTEGVQQSTDAGGEIVSQPDTEQPGDGTQSQSEVPPNNEVIPVTQSGPDIYLLIGQSNMVGSGNDVDAAALLAGLDSPNARITQLNVKENLIYDTGSVEVFIEPFTPLSPQPIVTADDPLHEPFEPTRQGKSGTWIGLGLSFAKAALADTDHEVLLVPAAYGGTGFCDSPQKVAWNTTDGNEPPFGNDWLYLRAIERTNTAITESGGVLRGILWHQGETDGATASCAMVYQQNLQKLATALRTNINQDALGPSFRGANAMIPFVVGTMSRGVDLRGDYSQFDANKNTVDAAHRTVSSYISHAGFVNNDDLVPPDYPCGAGSCLHFGSVALREMGHRYYKELRRIRERP